MDYYEVDATTAKPQSLSYSLFLLKATVKAVLSARAVQHTRAYLKTPNISAVHEGSELQTGGKSLQRLLADSRCREFLGWVLQFLLSSSLPRVPGAKLPALLRMYWMAGTFTQFSLFPIWIQAQEMRWGRGKGIVCVCDLWKGEGRVSEWPEGWAGTCPGKQPGQAVAKPPPVASPSPCGTPNKHSQCWTRHLG